MISFNYLRGDCHNRLRDWLIAGVPRRLRAPAGAVCISTIMVVAGYFVENARLRNAVQALDLCKSRYKQSAHRLASAHVYYQHVTTLVRLDKRVRMLRASGDAEAMRFAAIANRLPAHSWLVSATHDARSLVVAGRARNLTVLAETLEALWTRDGYPILVRSHELALSGLLEYELRVGLEGR